MSQITKSLILGMLFLIGPIMLINCGTSNTNSNAPFDADTQKHPAGWLPAGHMTVAENDISSCEGCHGGDLSGGISKVSCTSCHMGGAVSVHPADWGSNILTMHGPYTLTNGVTACRNQYCHGSSLNGVVDSGPSCNQCH